MKQIILASSSPRRFEILAHTGLPFDVVTGDYVEDNSLDLPPHELVMHLAKGKAMSVAHLNPEAVVIAADTLVVIAGRVLGKPANTVEVAQMISALSGRWHYVYTGIALVGNEACITDVSRTRVHFRKLTRKDIQSYALLVEPLDKAGAYGIQTTGALFIDKIEGDYHGMVGLPVILIERHLQAWGIDLLAFAR